MVVEYNNREDFVKCSYDNTWVTAFFCSHCGMLFEISISISFNNVYKLKDLFFCEKCYKDIQLQHTKRRRGVIWKGEQYWFAVTESPDLQ